MMVVVFAQKAPVFLLKDIDGNIFNLSDYKGKVVFLDFWTTWCPPCRAAIPAVKELHKTKTANYSNVVILGINIGEKQSIVEQFVKSNGITYNILLGDDKICGDYRVTGFPSFFIIDVTGEIVKRYVGYYPGLEEEWNSVIDELVKIK
ncbi:MAG: TlpA family protein disulfide reductase [Endomicrobium sp.]|nr:TlpA family protein disulfide reductase [Endomicrobium sp.]